MQPALQLLGAKGFAPPLRYKVGKRGGVQAQQINGFVGVHVVGAMNVAGWPWLSGCKCYLRGRRKRFQQKRFQTRRSRELRWRRRDRKSVGQGKWVSVCVDSGGRRSITQKKVH